MMKPRMADPNVIADYMCAKLLEAGERVTLLKLQKLLFYAHAWYLAKFNQPLFGVEFEAWVHGPVLRDVFIRYRGKSMYDSIARADLSFLPDAEQLEPDLTAHLDEVLHVYGSLTGSELEELTHSEEPWQRAREGLKPLDPSRQPIKNEWIASFYGSRLLSQ